MTPKDIITSKVFCPLPWTGFYSDISGDVKNCICSRESIGNLKTNSIHDILSGPKNTQIKQQILNKEKPYSCSYCYELEEDKKVSNIVSSRVYYLRQLKTVDATLYDSTDAFNLHHIDIRWRNTCNHACVYCGPVLSSKWASELNITVALPEEHRVQELKNYVFGNLHQIKNIYMAGGEPLLIKENAEMLELLLEKNPDVEIRINTNLSKTDTNIMDLVCQFKNVHWTVSAESIGDKFEYMRYGGVWSEFVDNLEHIRGLSHKLTFNMVWCILNHTAIFECIDYFLSQNFHPNSFILTAITGPSWLDCRHLPDNMLQLLMKELQRRIDLKPGYLLEDGYCNLLRHLQTPFTKNLEDSLSQIQQLDLRRNLDSNTIFKDLYKEIYHGKTI
jgi:MoaA/NifB/PqqE/SkfB family radical SAM enzyme